MIEAGQRQVRPSRDCEGSCWRWLGNELTGKCVNRNCLMKSVYGAISSCAINKNLTVFIINLLIHRKQLSVAEPASSSVCLVQYTIRCMTKGAGCWEGPVLWSPALSIPYFYAQSTLTQCLIPEA